ncbi:hypothetical protein D3C80_1062680 [compost metagenome]
MVFPLIVSVVKAPAEIPATAVVAVVVPKVPEVTAFAVALPIVFPVIVNAVPPPDVLIPVTPQETPAALPAAEILLITLFTIFNVPEELA